MYNYFCGFSKNATRMAYSVSTTASPASSSSSSGVVASAAAEVDSSAFSSVAHSSYSSTCVSGGTRVLPGRATGPHGSEWW